MREIRWFVKKYWLIIVVTVGFIFFGLNELYANDFFTKGKLVNMIFACPDGQDGICWHREAEIVNNEITGFYEEKNHQFTGAGKLVSLSCLQLRNNAGRATNEFQCDDDSGNIWMVYRGDSFKSHIK